MACNRCEKLGEESGKESKSFCQCKISDSTKMQITNLSRNKETDIVVDSLEMQAIRATYELDAILLEYRNKRRDFITYDELEQRVLALKAFADSLFVMEPGNAP